MPLRERTVDIADEIDRLEREREALIDEVAAMDDGHPEAAAKVERGRELDAHLDGLEWAQRAHEDDAVPAWDEDVDTLTFGGLTGGEYGKLEQDLTEAAANSNQGIAGAERVYQVRAGTINAPYLDPAADGVEQLSAVASLPVGFLKYAQDQIDELSSVGNGDRQPFDDLVAARATKQNET
jgi:hypothetical protein